MFAYFQFCLLTTLGGLHILGLAFGSTVQFDLRSSILYKAWYHRRVDGKHQPLPPTTMTILNSHLFQHEQR
jgi:hypothetical protein